ncbi:MAG: lytic transglycosylase domain-containing protein [Verrucomicrobiota bacterium]|nr:lytic transglycosylase domain-containing protein [Verrucomicrobiota bacterium]
MKRRWIIVPVLFSVALILLFGLITRRHRQEQMREHRFDQAILQTAQRYNIDPALIKAVIWQESRFRPEARGAAGEIGLMQVRDLAAEEWAEAEGLENFFHEQIMDPVKNIQAGSWYLAKVMKRYTDTDNPIPYALADYNAGRTHVLKWIKGEAKTNSEAFLNQIAFPGTRKYAENVMNRVPEYQRQFTLAAQSTPAR